ncbi:MAG: TatD family deoxyribonuclease [Deltaproteobacteria bacterium]|nr:TatD family deoxyribonuclease [Deltaproteobacteria bacterium]
MTFKPARLPPDLDAFGAIDSHAHLDSETFGDDLEGVLSRAWNAGIRAILAVAASESPDIYARTTALAARNARVFAALGIHPHNASLAEILEPPLLARLEDPKVVALGEIGLDFHYRFSPEEVQKDVMHRQVGLALDKGLPVILHVREAHAQSLAILDSLSARHRGVVHCFTGGPREAEAYLERGLHISIPGVVTFGARAGELAEAVRIIPEDRLLVESDTPFLAPHPFRGRRNEPALVALVVKCVARLRGTQPEVLAGVTAANTLRLFGMDDAC